MQKVSKNLNRLCEIVITRGGTVAKLESLLRETTNTSPLLSNLLPLAAQHGQTEMIKFLLDKGANVDHQDHRRATALMLSAKEGYTEVVKLLLDRGAKVDSQNETRSTPLMAAAENGHTEITKLLLNRGAKVDHRNNYDQTALIFASNKGKAEIVKLLLDKGASVHSRDNSRSTSLHHAASGAHTEAIKLLLDKGAKIDSQDDKGKTPLFVATISDYTEVVKLLLDKGANADIPNPKGDNALSVAARKGYTKTVKLLLDKGAKVDYPNNDGYTALMFAALFGHIDIVKAFLDKGANVDHQGENGWTALMSAADCGYTEIAKLLLNKDANPNLKGCRAADPNLKEYRAIDFIKQNHLDSPQILKLLREANAEFIIEDREEAKQPLSQWVANVTPTPNTTYEQGLKEFILAGALSNISKEIFNLITDKKHVMSLIKICQTWERPTLYANFIDASVKHHGYNIDFNQVKMFNIVYKDFIKYATQPSSHKREQIKTCEEIKKCLKTTRKTIFTELGINAIKQTVDEMTDRHQQTFDINVCVLSTAIDKGKFNPSIMNCIISYTSDAEVEKLFRLVPDKYAKLVKYAIELNDHFIESNEILPQKIMFDIIRYQPPELLVQLIKDLLYQELTNLLNRGTKDSVRKGIDLIDNYQAHKEPKIDIESKKILSQKNMLDVIQRRAPEVVQLIKTSLHQELKKLQNGGTKGSVQNKTDLTHHHQDHEESADSAEIDANTLECAELGVILDTGSIGEVENFVELN